MPLTSLSEQSEDNEVVFTSGEEDGILLLRGGESEVCSVR